MAARFAGAILLAVAIGTSVSAQPQQVGQTTGLPIPRFVSLAANEVNVRTGPGSDYPIAWVFQRARYPVEVTQEFDNWRRIRDIDGSQGWVLGSLLSADRTGIIRGEAGTTVPIRASASVTADITAYLEPGVQAPIDECSNGWCRLLDTRFSGWIEQGLLWGTYPNETID